MPMITVMIPVPLRTYVDNRASVAVEATSVADALHDVVAAFPEIRQQLFDDTGALRRFIVVFRNGEDIRMLNGLASSLAPGDALEILPAIAGGNEAFKSSTEWRKTLAREVRHVLPDEAQSSPAVRLDVRTADEWAQGHLPHAIHLDRGFLELQIESVVPDRGVPILVYCESGARSLFAANALNLLGYTQVFSLADGVRGWKAAGLPLVSLKSISATHRQRYLRQLALPEVGEAGQLKLLESKILVVGVGGLGCPAALYLAAAGIGTLGIADDDVVERSNLHRQILHREDRVGRKKVEVGAEQIGNLNSDVKVISHDVRITDDNVDDLVRDYDLVIDGSDNFSTRYMLNDACLRERKILVHGSVYRFEGMVSVFGTPGGPCYRCLFPIHPPAELAPSCAEGGVLGILPGTIGLLQATEAIKSILGIGNVLSGRAIRYEALGATFRELRFPKAPDCMCNEHNALLSTLSR
jgi:sulfur-carrier protein adenylyltransferase/sulfurtransferase